MRRFPRAALVRLTLMRRLSLLLLAFALAIHVGATIQVPDRLKIGDQIYDLSSSPLIPFLDANPGRLPRFRGVASDLWRGYVATWFVRNSHLFIEDVQVRTERWAEYGAPESEQYTSVMEALFGGSAPRVATWFTGHIVVSTEEIVDSLRMHHASTDSSYLIVTVVEGVVRQQQKVDARGYEKFRRAQFAAWKKTPDYAEAVAYMKKKDDTMSDEMVEESLFYYSYGDYTSRVYGKVRP